MPAFLTFLAILLTLTGLVLTLRRRGTAVFRLDQFAPASPLAGILPEDRDAARARHDLQAVAARSELGPAPGGTLTTEQSS